MKTFSLMTMFASSFWISYVIMDFVSHFLMMIWRDSPKIDWYVYNSIYLKGQSGELKLCQGKVREVLWKLMLILADTFVYTRWSLVIYLFVHKSWIYSFIHSSIHFFVCYIHSFVQSLIHLSFIQSLFHLFARSIDCVFV